MAFDLDHRLGRDRKPRFHELAGVVTSLGYGTAGLSLGPGIEQLRKSSASNSASFGKVFKGTHFFDVIFGSANGMMPVGD